MKREKITERYEFTEDERWDILRKTGQRCAHCGRPIFAILGNENIMTVDHYIPLQKGGTNRMINLIPLCKKCNQEKDNKIVEPKGYFPYLKEKYLKELEGYHDSYIHSFRYLSDRDLLAEDEFTVEAPYYQVKGTRNNKPFLMLKYQVKKAGYSDLDKIYDFYVRYLKKYETLKSEEKAKADILSWFQNGCMYYIEKNDSIMMFVAFDILLMDSTAYFGSAVEIWPFSYYNRQETGMLISKISFQIPLKIIEDCDIKALPVVTSVLCKDHIYDHLTLFPELFARSVTNGITRKGFNIVKKGKDGIMLCSPEVLTSDERENMNNFMKNFRYREYSVDDIRAENACQLPAAKAAGLRQ